MRAAGAGTSRCYFQGGHPQTQQVSILPCAPLSPPQLPVAGSRLCLYEDGTELTGDYFASIPDNSELVLLTEGQTWQGCKWRGRWEAGRAVEEVEAKGLVDISPRKLFT